MICLLKELLMIGVIVKVKMSCTGDFSCSVLKISNVMNSSSFWSISLTSVSTLSLFTVTMVVFNHLRA